MTPSGSLVIGDCAASCPTKNFKNVQNLTKTVLSEPYNFKSGFCAAHNLHCCLRGDRTAIFIYCHKGVAKTLAFTIGKGSKGGTTPRGERLCCQAKETAPLGVRCFVVKQRRWRPSG